MIEKGMSNKVEKPRYRYYQLASYYEIPARAYFELLRLAVYKTEGAWLDSSYELVNSGISTESWELAVELLEVMYRKEDK